MSKDAAIGADCRRGDRAGDGASIASYFEKDPRGFAARSQDVRPRRRSWCSGREQADPRRRQYADAATRRRRRTSSDRRAGAGRAGWPPRDSYNARVAGTSDWPRARPRHRAEVAELYGLPPSVIRDDPLQGRTPDVYRWVLKGDVDGEMRESVNRVIRDVRKKGGNVLILVHQLRRARPRHGSRAGRRPHQGPDRRRADADHRVHPRSRAGRRDGDRARLHRDRDDAKQGRRGRARRKPRSATSKGYLKVDQAGRDRGRTSRASATWPSRRAIPRS